MNIFANIDPLISELSRKVSDNQEFLDNEIYAAVSDSLSIDGIRITETEVRIISDMDIALNGISVVEKTLVKNMVRAYRKGLEIFENHTEITPQRMCALKNELLGNNTSSYSVYSSNVGLMHTEVDFYDPVWEKCMCDCGCDGAKTLDSLAMLCEEINSLRKGAKDKGLSNVLCLSFLVHGKVVNSGIFGEATGRMARMMMNLFQREMSIPMIPVPFEEKNRYIEIVSDATSENESLFKKFMISAAEQSMKLSMEKIDTHAGRGVKVSSSMSRRQHEAKMCRQICLHINQNSKISSRKIAMQLNIPCAQVRRYIVFMRDNGVLQHTGSNKGGDWRVLVDLDSWDAEKMFD